MATLHCLHDPGGERCETGLIPLIDGESDIVRNGGLSGGGEKEDEEEAGGKKARGWVEGEGSWNRQW
ncbi:hypothetical protein TRV_06886 [Trichophyton verrucosum HKI 0517]|uniref:Uncharacterized protein n=1 Tax=Trichophyton verrucosum (strain HKI 0517) TaxID=663202 RepID=D4DI78_TRIVH|nr:uncharacterized protein TRV_06886 [Trichophyton verrucosum HKI 0517]EFE38462.1 hypothetical protein TRV_06886 [Trichophyton verrucosum HKI 0517]